MAKKDDLELDDEKAGGGGSSKKMIIIFAIVAVVLVGASVGVTLMLVGGGDEEQQASAEPAEPVKQEPHYLELKPLIVNFGEKGPARFLQVEMQVMAYDQAVLGAVEQHMPVVRNNLLVLMGSQTFEQVSTRAGKEKLQADMIAEINEVLAQQADMAKGIESVYFTSFVMQ